MRSTLSVRIGASLVLLAVALAVVAWQAGIGEIWSDLLRLPFVSVLAAAAALIVSTLFAILRVRFIARDLGHHLTWHQSTMALCYGSLAGAMFFQIAGQLIARSAYLSRIGVPVGATVFMVGYERIVALAVALTLAALGGWHTFGRVGLQLEAGGAEFLKFAVGLTAAALMAAAFGWGRVAIAALQDRIGLGSVFRILRSIVLTLAIQLCTLAAYVFLALGLVPDIALLDLAAALTVVILGASLPISFGGWGVRELSAVVVLAALGISASKALIVAAIVGALSLAIHAGVAVIAVLAGATASRPATVAAPSVDIDYGKLAAIIVSLAIATAVFFHVHVPVGAGLVNISLADPLALLAAGLLVVSCLARRRWPAWRLAGANLHAILCTAALTLGLLIGLHRFGWSDWAFTNKFAGWFILLAYAAGGALIVDAWRFSGLKIVLAAFAATGVAIAGLDIILLALHEAGVAIPGGLRSSRSEGFAANPNAFGFQMLLVMAASFVAFRSAMTTAAFTAIALAGIALAGSKAALATVPFLLVTAILTRNVEWRAAGAAIAGAALLIVVLQPSYYVTRVIAPLPQMNWTLETRQSVPQETGTAATGGGAPTSAEEATVPARPATRPGQTWVRYFDPHRLRSIEDGIQLFLAHPLFGAGLGAYVAGQAGDPHPLTIHSTAVWLLAELGLVGFLVFALPALRIVRSELRDPERDTAGSLLLLIIVCLAVMSLAHELLYQRTFWFLLGGALACARQGVVKREP